MFSVEWLEVDVDYPSACYLYLDGLFIGKIGRKSHNTKIIKYQRSWVSRSSKAMFFFSKLDITGEVLLLPACIELITDAAR